MIRRLDPDSDQELYRQMWQWREEYPRSLREAVAVDSVETFDEFLEQSRGARADVGVFENNLIGCISLQWKADGIYEVHFSAKRGCSYGQMIEPWLSIQKTVFEELNARFIYAFTPEWNRGLIVLAIAIGLERDGVRKIRGTCRDRTITWIRLSQTRAQYESDTANKPDADRNGAVFTERIVNSDIDAGSEYSRHRTAA